MAEDTRQKTDERSLSHSSRFEFSHEDCHGSQGHQVVASPPSKEILHQQRQKCELRRLLKHTHPELRMSDKEVGEELAEVLNTETAATAAESDYEGDVLSKRLIFESCAQTSKVSPCPHKTHVGQETERGQVSSPAAVLGKPEEKTCVGANEATEEENERIDLHKVRMIFESQSLDTISKSVVQQQTQAASVAKRPVEPSGQHQDAGWSNDDDDCWNDTEASAVVNTDVAVAPQNKSSFLQNNPFISKNIEKEYSNELTGKSQIPARDNDATSDCVIANVKDRAQLFESMPFDKIQHQNKDEIEMMVEIIKESLDRLYHANALHSKGSIIEVHETMIAKKAEFVLSECGPVVSNDEVCEGNSQNFILHLLPRANLEPRISYLKEDSKGNMLVTKLMVPVHHQQIMSSQETEFKTASLVQLVEDILCQDNSLRKGVLIQDSLNSSANVTVYSLYSYANRDDVRSYCPLPDSNVSATRAIHKPQKQSVQVTSSQSTEPEVAIKGNVKLFKSCIEKGDLEYLKTLQTDTESGEHTAQQNTDHTNEIPTEHQVDLAEDTSEWAQVDVKRLKSMFNGDSKPTPEKSTFKVNSFKSTAHQSDFSCASVPIEKGQSSHEDGVGLNSPQGDTEDSNVAPCFPIPMDDQIHQAELVQVVDEADEIMNLQTAIQNLQMATMEAKSLQTSIQGKHAEIIERAPADFKHKVIEESPVALPKPEASASILPEHKENHSENYISDESMSAKGTTHETSVVSPNISAVNDLPHDNEEPELQGKLKAALESLEKSNINVTRGDFKAAMLYRNSPRATKERLQNVATDAETVSKDEASANTESKRANSTANDLQSQKEIETTDDLTKSGSVQKCQRLVGPKPTIPPKPARLIVKSTSKENKDENKENHLDPKTDKTQEALINSEGEIGQTASESEKQQTKDVVMGQQCQTSAAASHVSEALNDGTEEPILDGKLRAALDSLQKSNINVTRGDFKAAMIYRNSSKAAMDRAQIVKTDSNAITVDIKESSTKEQTNPDDSGTIQREMERINRDVLSDSLDTLVSQESTLASNNSVSADTEQCANVKQVKEENTSLYSSFGPMGTGTRQVHDTIKPEADVAGEENVAAQESSQNPPECGASMKSDERNIVMTPGDALQEPKKDDLSENDECHLDFSEAFKKFECKKACSVKSSPVKPKRVKIAQPESQEGRVGGDVNNSKIPAMVGEEHPRTTNEPFSRADEGEEKVRIENGIKQEGKVELREKKARPETEYERRQRLSVHMDEIMRGNITAAMEIFDHLRKQEELQNILTRVEEIEQDTSEVDVKSLRSVFEDVPEWVVNSAKKTPKDVRKVERNGEKKPTSMDAPETKSPMAHIFGDLERASEDIMNLKEQTLARLLDIEEAIKKALYSVSTLKSDSDIAGLSCLLKESLGTVQGSSSSANISKISIGSSRTKQKSAEGNSTTPSPLPDSGAKRRPSPPSSPAYISIQSAARKNSKADLVPPDVATCPTCQQSPRTERKFRTTKTLECNSPALNRKIDQRVGGSKITTLSPLNPKREFSLLEVKTDHEQNRIFGTKTVTENYEMTDPCGNRFYTSKTSTIVTTQPETMTSSGPIMISSPMTEVTTYPELRLPINQKP
ncbi:xin actin-binding repeat-containing protein 1-like isoform X2 [Synchiropus splendidus]|nr:xin actin-binding repeat-containing protein 1-like isoform X2 [Synchiropus splendidus]